MIIFAWIVAGMAALYLVSTLALSYLVQRIPRNPVSDQPDWGRVTDATIPSVDGGFLEVWRIEPDGPSRGIILLAHGWGRNRDRMVHRARMFGEWGYTVVIHSARDHGKSSPSRRVSAATFAEDIEAVMKWVGEPVMLYGHSAGAAGAIIAAHKNPANITRLFLEACYADTKEGLRSLYNWANRFFGVVFAPMVIYWWDLFYRGAMDRVSPVRLAADIKVPVMLIHGEKDQRFPVAFAYRLQESFPTEQVDLFIAEGADHSDSSHTPGYREAVEAFLQRYGDQ